MRLPHDALRPALLLLLIAIASPAGAQIAQQGGALIPSTAAFLSSVGWSNRMSSDGNTLAVGGPFDNSNVGAVWIFTRSAGVWSQQGSKLIGSGTIGAADQGYSVSLSADGNTAAVGGPGDNGGVGAVWIYTQSGGIWTQQGSKLIASGTVLSANVGFSMALSADGNTLAVGGPFDNSNVGAVWIFTRSAGVWSQQGSKLIGSGTIGAADQGYSVSLSADGNTLIEGAAGDNGGVGSMIVFTRSGGVWSQQGSKLIGTGAVGGAQQGISVSLSADGNTAAVGGNFDNNQVGATWIFTRSGSTWSQQGAKLVGSGSIGGAWEGIGTALSSDGNTLVVGASQDNGAVGAAWVFTRSAGTWTQLGNKLAPPSVLGQFPYFGCSATISGDGNTFEVGAYGDNSSTGVCRVFVRPAPDIVSVSDVPNDQGGQVSLRWASSVLDYTPSDPITAYGIWRQVPASAAARMLSHGARLLPSGSPSASPGDLAVRATGQSGATYYWEYLGSEPAHGYPGYSYTASTLSDSLAGSNPETLFMVEAQQTAAGLYWPSTPDSGYSVDNLKPATPLGLAGTYTSGSTQLLWQPNSDADLGAYRIYRGVTLNFPTSSSSLVAQVGTNTTNYLDNPGAAYYYKLTAVDVHGNESAPATLLPSNVTAVDGVVASQFALAFPSPNPMESSTTIRYSLPRSEGVALDVFDVGGRRVRALAEGSQTEGAHSLAWDRRDAAGHRASSGIYFVRLTAGGQSLVRRLALIR